MTDRLLFDIASSEPLLALLRPVLGDNLILYAASTVLRQTGERHPWHVDIESSSRDGQFATIWIGLRNTSTASGLKLIPGSQHYPQILQQVQHAAGYRRGAADDDRVLGWARTFDPTAVIAQPTVRDGDAIVFDGRLWHGSRNERAGAPRLALLLQYASASTRVRKTARKSLEWPLSFDEVDRPPVLPLSAIAANADAGNNHQVAPPPTSPANAQPLGTKVQPVTLPLTEDAQTGWRQHPFFNGLSPVHDALACHASVLSPGHMPHPPHCHIEEEILVVLDGTAELLIGPSSDVSEAEPRRLEAGGFAYYPAYQHHTLRNIGAGPLTYLMFRWRGAPTAVAQTLNTTVVDPHGYRTTGRGGFRTEQLFEGPTHWLGKLHTHYSEVEPGGGYDAHGDPYDLAIVVLSGTLASGDQEIGPGGVLYHSTQELHGLRGVGPNTARYLVFEFHGHSANAHHRPHIRGAIHYEEPRLYHRIARPLRQLPGLRRLLPRRLIALARDWLR